DTNKPRAKKRIHSIFLPRRSIFGEVKDTNKPGGMPNLFEHFRGESIFGEAKDTESRVQKQTIVCLCRDIVSKTQTKVRNSDEKRPPQSYK
ncbi:hypothetical protein, partial [uncultured Alistipes sp.]|uniref:hypothetical protein n=1 Tax=uncultured Alistipes sp. TaxID=538949 RepID=UPI002596F316